MIFQLASQDESLQTVVCEFSRENLSNSLETSEKLLSSLLAVSGPVYVIIDGLDEIDENERNLLLKHLISLLKVTEELKVCISSRPETDIKRHLTEHENLTIWVDTGNSGSIQIYVDRWSQNWLREHNGSGEAKSEILRLLAPLAWKSKGEVESVCRMLAWLT